MSTKNINFDYKKNQKSEFYKNKKAFQIDYVDANKILVSKKKHMVQIMLLNTLQDIMIMMCLILPLMTAYAKKFNENATMSFRANNF